MEKSVRGGISRAGEKMTDGMKEREKEAESAGIMFGLGLPAGSFPLRSREECEECCARKKEGRS